MALTTPGRKRRAAIFLDKDGTVLDNVPYNVDPVQMRWAPGARAGVQALAGTGLPLIVISNQPGVALGRFTPVSLCAMMRRLFELFSEAGAPLAGFYCCPHHPDGHVAPFARFCDCRKPAPGLLLRAASELDIDLSASWMIGDILDDVQAGHAAGCRSVLLDVGNETEWLAGPGREPEWRVGNLEEAARRLCASQPGQ